MTPELLTQSLQGSEKITKRLVIGIVNGSLGERLFSAQNVHLPGAEPGVESGVDCRLSQPPMVKSDDSVNHRC